MTSPGSRAGGMTRHALLASGPCALHRQNLGHEGIPALLVSTGAGRGALDALVADPSPEPWPWDARIPGDEDGAIAAALAPSARRRGPSLCALAATAIRETRAAAHAAARGIVAKGPGRRVATGEPGTATTPPDHAAMARLCALLALLPMEEGRPAGDGGVAPDRLRAGGDRGHPAPGRGPGPRKGGSVTPIGIRNMGDEDLRLRLDPPLLPTIRQREGSL